MRLGHDQRVLAHDRHAVGEPDVVGHHVAPPVRQHHRHDAGLALLPRHRARHVHPARPAASTTISLNGCPSRRTPSAPARDHTRVGGDHQPTIGQPVDRERQPFDPGHDLTGPSASNASTSPASQSHIQNRPSCQRGDSPIWMPVAKVSVMEGLTPAADGTHRPSRRPRRRSPFPPAPGDGPYDVVLTTTIRVMVPTMSDPDFVTLLVTSVPM